MLQARAIQELAKKDFENLRQDSDASEPEPEPEPELEQEQEPEPKPQPRRGRPPNNNNVKQKVGRPPAERANADFSGSSLPTASNSGCYMPSEFDLSRRAMIADVLRASFANQRNEYNWSADRKTERIEDYPGFILYPFSYVSFASSAFDENTQKMDFGPNFVAHFLPVTAFDVPCFF